MFVLLLPLLVAFVVASGTLLFLALYLLFRVSMHLPLAACLFAVPFIPRSFWHAMPWHAVLVASLFSLGAMSSLCDVVPKFHRMKRLLAFLSLMAVYCLGATLWFPATGAIGMEPNFEIPLVFCVFSNLVVHMMCERHEENEVASSD